MKEQLYFGKLDTLRLIAFFLVIWEHCLFRFFENYADGTIVQKLILTITKTGGVGVQIFFVISGFLITYLMIREEQSKGNLNVLYFYLRRFLRIWPLYFLVMILGIFILPKLFNTFYFNGDAIKNLTFLNNFDKIGRSIPNIGISWSVAIEEQFYLVWPLIFVFIKKKNFLFSLIILVFILSCFFTFLNPEEAYFHTFSNVRFLMIGSAGSFLYSKHKDKMYNLSIFTNVRFSLIMAIIFLLILSMFNSFSDTFSSLMIFILPLVYLFLILIVVKPNSESQISFFSKLGKYTYGMYLYHYIIIIFVKICFDYLGFDYLTSIPAVLSVLTLSLILTIIISYISYVILEMPILKFKNKFSVIKTRI